MPDGGGGEYLVLNDQAAPEPTSCLLFGAVVSPLLLNRRRRGVRADN